MENKCLIAIIVLLTFYVLHLNLRLKNIEEKTNKTIERMSNDEESMEDKIKGTVNKVYLADVDAIRNLSEVAKKLQEKGIEIPGNLTVKGTFNYLPRGTIVAFNGTKAPSGWALCDGKNGTPDLRGRFIYGYGAGQGNVFNKIGGAEVHKLNINEMPSHNHVINKNGGHHHETIRGNVWDGKKFGRSNGALSGGGWAAFGTAHRSNDIFKTTNNGHHGHSMKNTGGNKEHNNMPPYRVLSYIMKL